jgi:hypothetical protein
MLCVGFEPTISVFERTKTVHSLDGAATVIGKSEIYVEYIFNYPPLPESYVGKHSLKQQLCTVSFSKMARSFILSDTTRGASNEILRIPEECHLLGCGAV